MSVHAKLGVTSEQHIKEIYPKPFEEHIGVLARQAEDENSHTTVLLKCANNNCLRLIFNADTPEANFLKSRLTNQLVGMKLGILMTDSSQPIRVRIIKARMKKRV